MSYTRIRKVVNVRGRYMTLLLELDAVTTLILGIGSLQIKNISY